MKDLNLMTVIVIALVLGACAGSGTRRESMTGEAASEDLSNEAQQLAADIQKGYSLHYDILARDHFDAAQSALSKANDRIKDHASRAAISALLSSARLHFNEAARASDRLYSRVSGILEARTSALGAGVRDVPALSKKLKAADDDVRGEIHRIARNQIRPERWARLQSAYLQLELEGIQDSKLHAVREKIDAAIKNGAQKNTPRTLAQAQRNLIAAENAIAADRHTPESYGSAIQKATNSAILLTEVLASTKRPEGVISEEAAKDIVLTNRDLRKLSEKLQEASSETATQDVELNLQRARLKEADIKLSLERAFDEARKELKPDQADVYSQGDRLLIRIKALEFPSGKADLPPASFELLSKVGDIAQELHPRQIIVEGHTDSTGKAQTNRLLSLDRAQAVASFFETKGLDKNKIETVGRSYDRPVVSNKTKTGRAQNRRVDVIIVPGVSDKKQQM
jgi:OOP family OmpA-OmpF porin